MPIDESCQKRQIPMTGRRVMEKREGLYTVGSTLRTGIKGAACPGTGTNGWRKNGDEKSAFCTKVMRFSEESRF
jgi:hypothetical protein